MVKVSKKAGLDIEKKSTSSSDKIDTKKTPKKIGKATKGKAKSSLVAF